MTPDDDTWTGRYVGRDDTTAGRDIFWVPPDAGPRERLPAVRRKSVDGPNWAMRGTSQPTGPRRSS